MPHNLVFEPFALPNGTILKNRILMAPMTTCSGFYDGTVTQDIIEYYRMRSGAMGAIIVECGFVDRRGVAFPGGIGIDDDDKIEGLSKIAKAIKEKGSKAIIQIYHGGRMVDPQLIGGRSAVAPSAIAAPRVDTTTPMELSIEEIDTLINQFGEAARRAIQAGFDGIEIHGANTYLIQQFYSPNSNQRTDSWGGDREQRSHFPLAVIDVIQKVIRRLAPKTFILGYRFSPEEIETPGIRFSDSVYLLEKIALKRLDYIHFSMGDALRTSIVDIGDHEPLIKKYTRMRSALLAEIPIIGVGNIINLSDVTSAIENGYDLVAVGRACIAYPDWYDRIRNNEILDLTISSNRRELLAIPEPLWRFPLVKNLIQSTTLHKKNYKPGRYKEIVHDDSHEFVINVDLANDCILDLTLDQFDSFESDVKHNFNEIKKRIINSNSALVDAISGATIQSEAFKKAVNKAISRSNREIVSDKGSSIIEKKCDIAIIGSGGAGLAAAIAASDEGADVIIFEKMSVVGGNTAKASAGMNAAETSVQSKLGVIDSKEIFYRDTFEGGNGQNNPELLSFFVEHSADAIRWLDKNDIQLSELTTTGGMSVNRTHRPADHSAVGSFLVRGLTKNINIRGIDVVLDADVTQIVTQNNEIIGVEITDEDNTTYMVNCKAVIVATGGFGANKKMIASLKPELTHFVTTNHRGAMGSGIHLLEAHQAGIVDMKEIQIHPTVEQKTAYLISEGIRGSGAILVSQEGKRFINELDTRDRVSNAILNLPEKYAYIIFDEQIKQDNMAVNEYLAQGFVRQSSKLSTLADELDLCPEILESTVNQYNQCVKDKHDPYLNRQTGLKYTISQSPFYAIKIAPGIHHTMGGITINTHAEVLAKNGEIIQGVYAAGEIVGGVHGANRIGGNAITEIIVFGIQAGKSAARYIQRKNK